MITEPVVRAMAALTMVANETSDTDPVPYLIPWKNKLILLLLIIIFT